MRTTNGSTDPTSDTTADSTIGPTSGSGFVMRGANARAFTTSPTDELRFLAEGDDESPDIFVESLAPGDGPPLHRHPWMTWEVVVSGRVRALVGTETVELGAGDLLITPPDVPHTFMAIGDSPAQTVGINWPGGFHRLYAEMAPLFATGGPPDFAALAATAQRHGAEILGPPLAHLEAAG